MECYFSAWLVSVAEAMITVEELIMRKGYCSRVSNDDYVSLDKRLAPSNNRLVRKFRTAVVMGIVLLLGPMISKSSQQNASEEEYRVYSYYLNGLTEKQLGSLAVIDDHTWSYNYDSQDWDAVSAKLKSKFARLSQETLDNYYQKNRDGQGLLLHSHFNLKVRYLLLRDPVNTVKEDYVKGEDGWKNFYRKYAGTKGLITFSRVGFNQNLDEALVHLVAQSGLNSGSNFFALLRKRNGRWQVISTLTMLQS
jgi:hypothetical protein